MTTATISPATISPATVTISTTPMIAARPDRSHRSFARTAMGHGPLIGLIARVVAGITGVVLGLAMGLVSAGFDTTRLLLAVGAIALAVGGVVALFTERTDVSLDGR